MLAILRLADILKDMSGDMEAPSEAPETFSWLCAWRLLAACTKQGLAQFLLGYPNKPYEQHTLHAELDSVLS